MKTFGLASLQMEWITHAELTASGRKTTLVKCSSLRWVLQGHSIHGPPVLTKFNGISWNSFIYLILDVVENLYKSLSCCQNRITCGQASYVIIHWVQFAIGQHSNHSQLVVRLSILRSQFIGLEIPWSYGRPVLIGKKLSLISFNVSKTD